MKGGNDSGSNCPQNTVLSGVLAPASIGLLLVDRMECECSLSARQGQLPSLERSALHLFLNDDAYSDRCDVHGLVGRYLLIKGDKEEAKWHLEQAASLYFCERWSATFAQMALRTMDGGQ
jgi:hypothetical protein